MLKPNLRIVKKPGRKTMHFDKEAALNLAFIIENAPEFSVSGAVREGLKMVRKSVEKRKNMQLTETSN